MWPFGTNLASRVQRQLEDELATVRGHVNALQATVADLQRQVRSLDLEWTDHYDKTRKLVARVVKRAERDTPEATADNGASGPSRRPTVRELLLRKSAP